MPKTVNETPKNLIPYIAHGVDLNWSDSNENATGDCPWCGKEGKLGVNKTTGVWKCLVCSQGTSKGGGNLVLFLRMLHERSVKQTTDTDYALLKNERKLLFIGTLKAWGLARSILTKEWLIPGYNAKGDLCNLYRYIKGPEGKRYWSATKTLAQQMHYVLEDKVHHVTNKKQTTFICEGPWDGMALWEMLRNVRQTDEGVIEQVGNVPASLYGSSNVIATPGANIFQESWLPLLGGKRVVLLYDSDHARENNGTEVLGAGIAGMKRVSGLLSTADELPTEVDYLNWGEKGFDKTLPNGYDLRDYLSEGATLVPRVQRLASLFKMIHPIPADWVLGRSKGGISNGEVSLECLECDSWKLLTNQWRKAMKWTEGLDRALSVMLSCVASTKSVGDQLWCKIVSPPSTGKSSLCEALSVNREHVLSKSSIRGFHSGFKTDKEGAEDHSLIAQLYNKTLITKDGDTLMKSPNIEQILSEARDIYDRVSRTHYRHAVSRDYVGINMTWILCGTSSIRVIDSSELGERFVDCVIMEGIDDELEDDILWRVVNRTYRNMGMESNGKPESQNDVEMTRAMQLTGGYVNYLHANAQQIMSGIQASDISLRKCTRLGKFISYARARPSKKQDESTDRELGARLASQMIRLAMCMAVVLNRSELDIEVMRRVKQVAMDTSRGRTLRIMEYLYKTGIDGATLGAVAAYTCQTEDTERKLLKFLRQIGAVESFGIKAVGSTNTRIHYKLTSKMYNLYTEVMED